FSLPGAGPVATGTLWSGSIGAGDRLQALPAGFSIRVRSVQVHGATVDRATAGQRVAVSVVAEQRRAGGRRAGPLAAAAPRPHRLAGAPAGRGPPPPGPRVTVGHGPSAVPARVVRVGERYGQLRLERPLVTARGDRFVLRRETTVGGGAVLDPSPPRRP